MGTFRHHPDGFIYIDDVSIPLSEFLIEEPAYTLPNQRAIGRNYDGVKDIAFSKNQEFDGNGEVELDGYIAKLATYQANIAAREQVRQDNGYAATLPEAQSRRITELRADAAGRFFSFEESDLEIGTSVLTQWKNDLTNQIPLFEAEVNALTTINDVRLYEYPGWPTAPSI